MMAASEMSQSQSFSCSGGESSETSDPVSDTESDSEAGAENDSGESMESHLDELYASFEFESDTESHLQPPRPTQAQARLGSSDTPLYPNAQLTAVQSRLLIFQYAL